MKEVGYLDGRAQKKTMKAFFSYAVIHAASKYGVYRSASGWEKKFRRLKKEYSKFRAMLQSNGRDRDDQDLFNTPAYFKELHELEKRHGRHDPPSILSSASIEV